MRAVMTKTPWEETYWTGTWADELHPDETVETSAWVVVEGSGLTLGTTGATQPQLSSPLVTVWTLQGGQAGVVYKIANRITTSLGRKLEGIWYLKIAA